jgi:hypothetical protein
MNPYKDVQKRVREIDGKIEPSKSSYFNDKNWVRSIFMINQETLDGASLETRTWSTSDSKFQDTAPGGSLVINPLPQPCLFTDPMSDTHWLKARKGANDDGLSPYFSETFDDNYRQVTFRFGTLAFNSLTGYLFSMFHPGAAAFINKGLINTLLFKLGRLVGHAVSIVAWPLALISMVGKAKNFFLRVPTSKYAYLKPNMPLYWSSVQTICNHFLVDLGLIHRGTGEDENGNDLTLGEDDLKWDENNVKAMKALWPNTFGGNGHINQFLDGALGKITGYEAGAQFDVFAVATRAQRLAHARYKTLEEIQMATGTKLDLRQMLHTSYRNRNGRTSFKLADYIAKWTSMSTDGGGAMYNADKPSKDGEPQQDENEKAKTGDIGDTPTLDSVSNDGFWKFLEEELREGGAFVSFRVDDTGAVFETFSNNYKTSSLMEKINSMSSTGRSTYFDLAGGNIGDDIVTNSIETVVSGIKSFASGVIETVGLGGLLIAGGGGTVSMPKYWESSEAQLPKPSYSFTLKARYANRRSAFNDVYFPLACILAAALPTSVGKHSHSNPLYCEFYDKGRMQSRLAAIDSITITRGDGTMGFTPEGNLMSINVSFSITPMEEIIAMPITEGVSLSDTIEKVIVGGLFGGPGGAAAGGALGTVDALSKGIFDDDTPFMDYMATLAGMGVNEQYYLATRLKRRLAFNQLNFVSSFSSARSASIMGNSLPGQLLGAIFLKDGLNALLWDERAER